MLSKYFKFKIKTKEFIENAENFLENYKDKKVLICGESEGFRKLDKEYNFKKKLSIVGFLTSNKEKNKTGLKTIEYSNLTDINFDVILITGEDSENIYNTMFYNSVFKNIKIYSLFYETIKEGKENLEYLLKYNFDKYLPKLVKKLKNKTVMFYGAGIYFELIKHYFDLSELNVVGIIDKKYKNIEENQEVYGYRIYKPDQITNVSPDYIIITAKRFVPIWETMYFGFLEKTKIKIIPILKKNIFSLICDIADS